MSSYISWYQSLSSPSIAPVLRSEEGIPASAFDRTCYDRTHLRLNTKGRFECRSSQLVSHVVALADLMIPSLPAMRRGGYLRSNVECTIERMHQCVRTHGLRSNAWLAFERRPVTF
jgi:hypothetical protein